MKGLIKKILAPIVVSAAILIPNFASAQETQEFKQKNYISAGIGAYNGTSQAIQDIYGTFPRFRASFGRDISEHFKLEGALAYLKKSGTPYVYTYGDVDAYDAAAEMSMLQIEALAKYVFRGKSLDFSIGGGLAMINAKEKIDMTIYYDGESESASAEGSKTAFGPVFILGADVPINKAKTTVFYVDLSGRSASVEGALGDKVDIGGGVIEVGVRFFMD